MLVGSAIGFLTWFCPVLIGWAEWEMQVIDSRILRDPAVFLFLSLSGLLSLSLFLFPLSLSPSLYSFLCMPVLCNSELKKVPLVRNPPWRLRIATLLLSFFFSYFFLASWAAIILHRWNRLYRSLQNPLALDISLPISPPPPRFNCFSVVLFWFRFFPSLSFLPLLLMESRIHT